MEPTDSKVKLNLCIAINRKLLLFVDLVLEDILDTNSLMIYKQHGTQYK
jgi:hypothetical protein